MGQLAGIPHACASQAADRVWVAYVSLSSPLGAALQWSDDHGVTWPPANVNTGLALQAEANRIQSYDLRCAGDGDSVYLMYGLASGASSANGIPPLDDVVVAHSSNGGQSWDARVHLPQNGLKFLRPEIALAPNGDVHVTAYAGTLDGDPLGAVRHWLMTDNLTLVEQEVVHQPIVFTGSRGGADWIGDYSGLVVSGGTLFVTYADNSNGTAHVAFRRIALR